MQNRPVSALVLGLGLLLVLSPAAASGQQSPPASGTSGLSSQAAAQAASDARPPFSDWLAGVRKEALARGISQRTIDAALTGIEPVPVVLERDRTQAERTLSLDAYLKRRLDRRTLQTARSMARAHAALLSRVSKRYKVPRSVLVAVWGLESNFGRFSGVRPTVTTLATLAYDNRRSALFHAELMDSLRILDRGDIEIERMKGSWAGAMGQPQFMPSSYLRYAQDFDEDGRTDIWRSRADVFASIANYLEEQGWQAGASWGRVVRLSPAAEEKLAAAAPLRTEGCEAIRQMTEAMPWSRWKALGVRLAGSAKAPAPDTAASLVRGGERDFLVFGNYHALLQYNCAHAYALSVALLSDHLSGKQTIRLAPEPKRARGATAKNRAKKRTPRQP